jgi:uncharacterized iron-regulated membrane protein
MNRKLIYKIHKWAGLTLGAIVFLLALSGVGITFRHELLPLTYSSLFHITPQEETLSLEELYTKAVAYLGEDKKITNLYASEDADEAHLILYKDPARSFPTMLTINPYDGSVVGEMGMIKNFFAIMLFMHSNLFLGNAGKYIVGIFGLILTFFVLSGIYIWLPTSHVLSKWKRTFHLTRAHLTQRLHHSFGLIFAIPLLISAITGSLIIFDVSYLVMRPLTGQPHKIEEAVKIGECSFEMQKETLKLITPEMKKNLISVHFCTPKNGLMKVSYGLHNQNFLDGYGRIVIDPRTSETLQIFNSEKDPSSWNSLRLTIYPIHTGEYLGLFGRIIVLITGVALMGIYCTGVMLYFKRRRFQK